jgi:hypothetical protein
MDRWEASQDAMNVESQAIFGEEAAILRSQGNPEGAARVERTAERLAEATGVPTADTPGPSDDAINEKLVADQQAFADEAALLRDQADPKGAETLEASSERIAELTGVSAEGPEQVPGGADAASEALEADTDDPPDADDDPPDGDDDRLDAGEDRDADDDRPDAGEDRDADDDRPDAGEDRDADDDRPDAGEDRDADDDRPDAGEDRDADDDRPDADEDPAADKDPDVHYDPADEPEEDDLGSQDDPEQLGDRAELASQPATPDDRGPGAAEAVIEDGPGPSLDAINAKLAEDQRLLASDAEIRPTRAAPEGADQPQSVDDNLAEIEDKPQGADYVLRRIEALKTRAPDDESGDDARRKLDELASDTEFYDSDGSRMSESDREALKAQFLDRLASVLDDPDFLRRDKDDGAPHEDVTDAMAEVMARDATDPDPVFAFRGRPLSDSELDELTLSRELSADTLTRHLSIPEPVDRARATEILGQLGVDEGEIKATLDELDQVVANQRMSSAVGAPYWGVGDPLGGTFEEVVAAHALQAESYDFGFVQAMVSGKELREAGVPVAKPSSFDLATHREGALAPRESKFGRTRPPAGEAGRAEVITGPVPARLLRILHGAKGPRGARSGSKKGPK